MKKQIIKTTLIMVASALLLGACKKDKDKAPEDTLTNETNSTQSEFDDILKLSEDALEDNGQVQRVSAINACATVTIDTAAKEITIDFGTGCVGSDGRTRKGMLVINYTGLYRTTGTVVTIETSNYYVNGVHVEGRRTVTNNGGNLYTVQDSYVGGTTGYAKLTYTDGTFTTWRSTRTRQFSAGYSTPFNWYDDEYLINGTADGTSREGIDYSMTADDIKAKIACWYSWIFVPVSGTLSLTADDGTRSVDYGSGECDKTILYTHTDGKTYMVILK